MMKRGIDVSEFQGMIDWDTMKAQIDFAIIRAGFGDNNLDSKFKRNADECTRLEIPFGAYWFSYALTDDDARKEADSICNAVAPYRPSYPICFDYEYDSFNYASRVGETITNTDMVSFAKTFLNRVEERGYYAALYSNPDFLSRGFSQLTDRYDLWLAHWGEKEPSRECGMWQTTSGGIFNGIAGSVDCDIAYKDYPSITSKLYANGVNKLNSELQKLKDEKWELYYKLAQEVWQGKWGNGADRKAALKKKGYDYDYVQSIVNLLG